MLNTQDHDGRIILSSLICPLLGLAMLGAFIVSEMLFAGGRQVYYVLAFLPVWVGSTFLSFANYFRASENLKPKIRLLAIFGCVPCVLVLFSLAHIALNVG